MSESAVPAWRVVQFTTDLLSPAMHFKRAKAIGRAVPPYSPEENRIERMWGDLHANVTRNHRCRKIEELMERVHGYMRSERARRRTKSRGSGARRAS